MMFKCDFCDKEFVKAVTYESHYCEKMKRIDFLKTNLGKISFLYYNEWLKMYKGATNITHDSFLNSRYFTSFIKFIKFSNRMLLPNKIAFMKYMISLNMLPIHWCLDEVYVKYIENLDSAYTPIEQVAETTKTLYELASIFECDIGDVFNHIQPVECIQLIKSRKLTPWLLLLSKKFHNYLSITISREQRNIISQTVINPSLWKKKFSNNLEYVTELKKIVQDLNL